MQCGYAPPDLEYGSLWLPPTGARPVRPLRALHLGTHRAKYHLPPAYAHPASRLQVAPGQWAQSPSAFGGPRAGCRGCRRPAAWSPRPLGPSASGGLMPGSAQPPSTPCWTSSTIQHTRPGVALYRTGPHTQVHGGPTWQYQGFHPPGCKVPLGNIRGTTRPGARSHLATSEAQPARVHGLPWEHQRFHPPGCMVSLDHIRGTTRPGVDRHPPGCMVSFDHIRGNTRPGVGMHPPGWWHATKRVDAALEPPETRMGPTRTSRKTKP